MKHRLTANSIPAAKRLPSPFLLNSIMRNLSVFFLFVVLFTTQTSTADSANFTSTTAPAKIGEVDEPDPAVKFLKDIAKD